MKKVDDVSLVFYSHSTYNDLWDIFTSSVEQFLNMNFEKFYFLCDEGDIGGKYIHCKYDNNAQYSKRLLSVVEKIDTKFVIVHHEDHFFHGPVDVDRFLLSKKVLAENPTISFIKYAKAGTPWDILRLSQYSYYKDFNLIRSDFDYVYTVQPNLWKTENLKKFLSNFDLNGWQMETDTKEYCAVNNIQGLCYYTGTEVKRGTLHWDSSIYPTINAISKGKWTTSQYRSELERATRQHGIDMDLRGHV